MRHAHPVPPPDPSGRLDLLLLRGAELVARKVEQAIGVPIWTDDLASAFRELIEDAGVPNEPVDVEASIGNALADAIRPQRLDARRRKPRSGGRRHVR